MQPPDLAAVDRQLSGMAGHAERQPPARLDAPEQELGDRPTALHPRVEGLDDGVRAEFRGGQRRVLALDQDDEGPVKLLEGVEEWLPMSSSVAVQRPSPGRPAVSPTTAPT